jgi:hypothetical protein
MSQPAPGAAVCGAAYAASVAPDLDEEVRGLPRRPRSPTRWLLPSTGQRDERPCRRQGVKHFRPAVLHCLAIAVPLSTHDAHCPPRREAPRTTPPPWLVTQREERPVRVAHYPGWFGGTGVNSFGVGTVRPASCCEATSRARILLYRRRMLQQHCDGSPGGPCSIRPEWGSLRQRRSHQGDRRTDRRRPA